MHFFTPRFALLLVRRIPTDAVFYVLTLSNVLFTDHDLAGPTGLLVVASEQLNADETIVTCPFSLAITPTTSKRALLTLLDNEALLNAWSERQLICVYIAFHWIVSPKRCLLTSVTLKRFFLTNCAASLLT